MPEARGHTGGVNDKVLYIGNNNIKVRAIGSLQKNQIDYQRRKICMNCNNFFLPITKEVHSKLSRQPLIL